MPRSRSRRGSARKRTRGRQQRSARQRNSQRGLQLEELEPRMLLAGLELVGILPNDGELLDTGDVRNVAPHNLTFRFNEGQAIAPSSIASGIEVTRSGLDGAFGDGADVVVAPGFIGLGESSNEIILRFAETLPDDLYQIDIFGSGPAPLRNTSGEAFNNGADVTVQFELNLGAQIVSVVPRPVTRQPDGTLSQARDQIVVYFNDDDLHPVAVASDDGGSLPSVVDPSFYQLHFTRDTVSNTDDVVHLPTHVAYDPAADTAVLTFASPIDELSGAGTYRLRVGTAEAIPQQPNFIGLTTDPGSSFDTAHGLGALDARTRILSSEIDNPLVFPLDFPGGLDEPGHRENAAAGLHLLADADTEAGITTLAYNFQDVYGEDPDGNPLFNVITETQKQRARDVFEIYSYYLGVQFYETADAGFTIATGDLRAIVADPTGLALFEVSGPGGRTGLAGDSDPDFFNFAPTAVMDNAEPWNDAFGADWFLEAMKQVGLLLGMGEASDLPQPTVTGGNDDLSFTNEPENVFPGDADIIHGQYLYRPESNDIDLYRFELDATGLFTAETIAERLDDSSLLDTALNLYRQQLDGSYVLLARNDDYFSEDSLIEVSLSPGTYFIGVSASGNLQYDPVVEDSGFGGTSQGPYDLRLNFRPEVNRSITDADTGFADVALTPTALDGDADGRPGGVFNFWFRAQTPANTLFVDKSNTPGAGGLGSLANPFNNINTAFSAADPGDIVRIVGNGGVDGDIATLADNAAYQIGFNALGQPLADGARMLVPRGVTTMIDAGAVFKLRRSRIGVGSASVGVDRSGAALQVLGTPEHSVLFTSFSDPTIGSITDANDMIPEPGDWGGIVYRNDMDRGEGRFDYEQEGIFLNHVNHADMRYGGGIVTINSVQRVIDPIHLIDARATATFNTIRLSADAAISANPDSFEETRFNAPDSVGVDYQAIPFTSDYARIGPEVHGNRLSDNTINGMFIRIETLAGNALERMTVSGRFNDTDVVHVIAENLIIQGTPGGPIEDPATGDRQARTDAQLKIDPAIVVKLDGARIESTIGTQLLAEGDDGFEVIFTSLLDDRFGAGGTFVTSVEEGQTGLRPGNWGGIYAGHTGRLSIDHARIAYAGGTTRVEGSFAGFNAVEIHQADARITNSILEQNLGGVSGQAEVNRAGRGLNAPAAIFVRAAQPVIANNIIRDTFGPGAAAININVNALNHTLLADAGRMTGFDDRLVDFTDNQGPLIRQNRLGNNSINGMLVRGATLTTESVWDDTDIVHVVMDEIVIPEFHTFGGLRLESSSTESLVVKLLGPLAGFHTSGRALDTEDRIGSILHVIGQSGHPVILTSLADDTVGAGLDPQGLPQTDTDNGGRALPMEEPGSFEIDLNFGPQARSRPQVMAAAEFAARMWERLIEDPITVTIDFEVADLADGTAVTSTPDLVSFDYGQVRSALVNDAREHESFVEDLPNLNDLQALFPNDPTNPFSVDPLMTITRANAQALGLNPPDIASVFDPDEIRDATIVLAQDALVTTQSEAPVLFDYTRSDYIQPSRFDATGAILNAIGTALGFVSGVDTVNASLAGNAARSIPLTPLDLFRLQPGAGQSDFATAPRALDPALDHVFYDGGTFNPKGIDISGLALGDIPLSTGVQFGDGEVAGSWKDDALIDGIYLGIADPVFRAGNERDITEADRSAFDLIGYDIVGGGIAGDWRGVTLETATHDRNVGIVTELEAPDVTAPGTNAVAELAENLGGLAPSETGGDDNQRLGFVIHGFLGEPADVDVYSFDATAGTELWLDIDRTTSTLDTVVELINAEDDVLARSDNSLAEGNGTESQFAAPGIVVNPMQKSLFRSKDHWSTNPKDAGMRVILPGPADSVNTYHVRVRSSSPDLEDVAGGETSGVYQLQIRIRDLDEMPGATLQYADIRYATDGIRIRGLPNHSPLQGEVEEDGSANDNPPFSTLPQWRFFSSLRSGDGTQGLGAAPSKDWSYRNMIRDFFPNAAIPTELEFFDFQRLGNILETDRGVIAVSGKLDPLENASTSFNADVDWYMFEVNVEGRDDTNPSLPQEEVELIFDIDYADGLGRADTALAIYQPSFWFGDPVFQDEVIPGVVDSTLPIFVNIDEDVHFDLKEDVRATYPDDRELEGLRLIFTSYNSQDADDRPAPLQGADLDDLSRGSVGAADPLLGPVSLPLGTYVLAVITENTRPKEYDQYELKVARSDFSGFADGDTAFYKPTGDFTNDLIFEMEPNNPFIRREPIDSVLRIAEDRLEPFNDFSTAEPPVIDTLFTDASAVPFHLGDVVLFVAQPNQLYTADPFSGAVETTVGFLTDVAEDDPISPRIADIAMKTNDKTLHGFNLAGTPGFAGNYLQIDTGDASVTNLGDDNITLYRPPQPGSCEAVPEGLNFVDYHATTFGSGGTTLFASGERADHRNPLIAYTDNILYQFITASADDNTPPGTAIPNPGQQRCNGAATDVIEIGHINTLAGGGPGGRVTGLAFVGSQMYAVSDAGGLFTVNLGGNPNNIGQYVPTAGGLVGISFQGLATGPQNTEGGRYANVLFGIDSGGELYAFNTSGQLLPILLDGESQVSTGVTNAVGLAFSTLDENLWHVTNKRSFDAGHGKGDIIRPGDGLFGSGTGFFSSNGGSSFYFGGERLIGSFDIDPEDDEPGIPRFDNYDFPGGAHGSLITNPFSLAGYSASDEPTLDFNYFLATEVGANPVGTSPFSHLFGDSVFPSRDSFRVFISDGSREDGTGQWHLLASNNTAEEFVDLDPTDDIDIDVQVLFDNSWEDVPDPFDRLLRNGLRDPQTQARADAGVPNEENTIWRQAHIDLGQFAGSDDLRLRFDFSTAGSMDVGDFTFRSQGLVPRSSGSELMGVDGFRIRDGETFIIDDSVFEFDSGFTIVAPPGQDIEDGETITIDGLTFEFDSDGSTIATNVIAIDDTVTAEEVARRIEQSIAGSGVTVVPHRNINRVNLEGATNVAQSPGAGLQLEGGLNVDPTNLPVIVHAGMTPQEVAAALVQPIADEFARGLADVIKSHDFFVRIIGHTVTDPGPLGLADELPGDDRGSFDSNLRGQDNAARLMDFEDVDSFSTDDNFFVPYDGVFIDDLIIGFSSRGEQVFDHRPSAPGNRAYYLEELSSFETDFSVDVAEEGEYTLEIRRASDYTFGGTPTETFDPRDRLTQAVTLFAPSGAQVFDGQTFTLGDGLRSVTFEYENVTEGDGVVSGNVPIEYEVSDREWEIAEQIRGVINSVAVQNLLSVAAAAPSGVIFGPAGTTDQINLFGNVIIAPEAAPNGIDFEVFDEFGSSNRFRDQGQVLILGNQISHSAMYGIVVEDTERDLPTYFFQKPVDHAQYTEGDYIPHSGSVRNLGNVNEEELSAGVTITNNVIAHGGEGGIHFSGNPNGFVIVAPIAGEAPDNTGPRSEVWDPGGPPPSPFSFSVTDHNGLTVIFEFDNGDGVNPGHVPIVFTANVGCPNIVEIPRGPCMPRYSWATRDMTDQMMEVIANTNLDINIHRGRGDELFLEGVSDVRGVTPGPPPLDWFEAWYSEVAHGVIPFGRVLNNTIIGQGGSLTPPQDEVDPDVELLPDFRDVGIVIDDNASPTVLNNIVVNFNTGIRADNSSQSSVLGANLYQGNVQNVDNIAFGDFAFVLADDEALFVNFENDNFYPAAGSRAIDSSVDTLEDRPALVSVKAPVGIPVSPVLAPKQDALGQLRVDDPSVESPEGFGESVFKDRGAIDRADFTGPAAQLIGPRDNDAAGRDLDGTPTVVQLVGTTAVNRFVIQLSDGAFLGGLVEGTGVDPTTVSSRVATITQRNQTTDVVRTLVDGNDYTFAFDFTNDTIRLTPLAGLWQPNNTYTIRLDNSAATGITDTANNPLRPNQSNGETVFTIVIGGVRDFGDAPDPTYPTLIENNGARHLIVDGFFLGAGVDAEFDGQPTAAADGDGLDDDGVAFNSLLTNGTTASITVTASASGLLDAWIDYNNDGDFNDAGEQIFSSEPLTAGANSLGVPIPQSAVMGTTVARFRLSKTGGLAPTGQAADGEVEDYRVVIGVSIWQNPVARHDVSANGQVAPQDVLQIFNELNNPRVSDPRTGALPAMPVDGSPPPYYDVNGDGFVTPLDALIVINCTNDDNCPKTVGVPPAAGNPLIAAGSGQGAIAEPSGPAVEVSAVAATFQPLDSTSLAAPFTLTAAMQDTTVQHTAIQHTAIQHTAALDTSTSPAATGAEFGARADALRDETVLAGNRQLIDLALAAAAESPDASTDRWPRSTGQPLPGRRGLDLDELLDEVARGVTDEQLDETPHDAIWRRV